MEAVALEAVVGTPGRPRRGEDKPSSTWPSHLGDYIYVEMKKREWTEAQVAQHFDVAQSTVSRWMAGKARPEPKRVKEVADFCKIDMATAFRMNYKVDPKDDNLGALTARVEAMEQRLGALTSEQVEVRNQLSIVNQALATLLDKVKGARGRQRGGSASN